MRIDMRMRRRGSGDHATLQLGHAFQRGDELVADHQRGHAGRSTHEHQVAGAAPSAAELGVSLFTIHASGGAEMMRAAVDSVNEVAAKRGVRSKVLAISVLTSIDESILAQIGVTSTPAESVLRLVKLAEASGVDGVVASPQEIESIRKTIANPEFLVVTPGIRPATTEVGDQKRVATPAAAIAAGASYLVVGRPITGAPDPLAAAHAIIADMELINKGGV